MGKLKDQMLIEMHLLGYSQSTIDAYIGHMVGNTRFHGTSPADLGDDEIRRYLYHLKTEKKLSYSNVNPVR